MTAYRPAVVHRLLERALDWVAPRACVGCTAPISGETGSLSCSGCATEITLGPFTRRLDDDLVAVAAFEYQGPVARAIRHLKYASRTDLADPLGAQLLGALLQWAPLGESAFVPVPAHPTRLAERGYNPAALIARAAALRHRADFAPRALRRVRATPPQTALKRDERAQNVVGAFEVGRLPPRHPLLLIDDVVTTGSTARACARAIRAAGGHIEVVGCVALATEDGPDRGATTRDREPA